MDLESLMTDDDSEEELDEQHKRIKFIDESKKRKEIEESSDEDSEEPLESSDEEEEEDNEDDDSEETFNSENEDDDEDNNYERDSDDSYAPPDDIKAEVAKNISLKKQKLERETILEAKKRKKEKQRQTQKRNEEQKKAKQSNLALDAKNYPLEEGVKQSKYESNLKGNIKKFSRFGTEIEFISIKDNKGLSEKIFGDKCQNIDSLFDFKRKMLSDKRRESPAKLLSKMIKINQS